MLNYTPLNNEYTALRYQLLLNLEETGNPKPTPYLDSEGIPTVGIGFNLRSANVLDAVLGAFGFNVNAAPGSIEFNYKEEIKSIVKASHASNLELDTQLNEVMNRRFNNHDIPLSNRTRADFRFQNYGEIRGVFDSLIGEYEDKVDAWLSGIPETAQERLSLVSLAWNNAGKLLGPGLKAALQSGDRAEAWYEIRYGSNGDKSGGIAKRRYYESDLFGLYNDAGNVSDGEAKQIYQMLQRHHTQIADYEESYGAQIDRANAAYGSSVKTLVDALQPARNYLIAEYVTNQGIPIAINGDILVGTDNSIMGPTVGGQDNLVGKDTLSNTSPMFSNDLILGEGGNDMLSGGAGDDVLYGDAGNDYLDGGQGADVMVGGADDDTYIVDNTNDVIIEQANSGFDQVTSSVTYTLSDNIENLTLIGTDAINGIGNALDNIVTGNSQANILSGGGGSDILLGEDGNDTLIGGSGIDTLLGGEGNDTLFGDDGTGGDILGGGTGFDTYYANEGDTIYDPDGQGTIYLNGKQLTFATRKKGETIWKDAAGTEFTLNGTSLQINDPLTIEGFSNGQLGIYLDDAEDPAKPPKKPQYNPNNSRFVSSSPLALDLNNNGRIDDIGLANSSVYFDLTQDGIAEKSGWLAPEDGLLAMDMNDNGVIDDRSELFGTDPQHTAFDRLAELVDANQDGSVNADDPLFSTLRVWQDANSDGISQAAELKTLDELGITSISTAQTRVLQTTANGNSIVATGSYIRNGQQRYATDIEFAYDAAFTDANPNRPLDQPPSLDGDVFQLPWLRGYGDVKSLHIAYQQDVSLRQAASNLIVQGRDGILHNFESFMAKWTGFDAAHQAKGVTRTDLTIADKVWMLESIGGQNVQKAAINAEWRTAA